MRDETIVCPEYGGQIQRKPQEFFDLAGLLEVLVPDIRGEVIEFGPREPVDNKEHFDLKRSFPMEKEVLHLFRRSPFSDDFEHVFLVEALANRFLCIPFLRNVNTAISRYQIKELLRQML